MIDKLKDIRNKGISISLCTAKPHFSIDKMIEDAGLDNYHITDGGGVLINPINHTIVEQYVMNKEKVKQVLEMYVSNNVYTEIYTVDNYFIQESQICDITTSIFIFYKNNQFY